MKTNGNFKVQPGKIRGWRLLAALLAVAAVSAVAADTNSPPMSQQDYFEGGQQTYNNWIEFSAGDLLNEGNLPEAGEIEHWRGGVFGGIEDLHIQGNAFTNTTFTIDGHSIFDNHDYDVRLKLANPDKWFVQAGAKNFRTWSDNLGGYYPPTGTIYSGGGVLALDRGEISFAAGLTPASGPALTFKYTHSYRNGDKSSTIWGPVDVPAATRGIYPGFYNLDETVDAYELDAKQQVKNTTLGLGLHYEHGKLNDALDETFYYGEPNQKEVTDREQTTYDLFSANASSETWLKDNLMFSAGGMYANLDNNFSGSRIYGNDFDVGYSPALYNGLGYNDMTGDSLLHEYVMDLNLLAIPTPAFAVIPSIRVQKETWDADSSGTATFSDGTFGDATAPFSGQSHRDVTDVAEGLEMRYTGITNWVFSLRGDWDEGDGSLKENGGLSSTSTFYFGLPAANNETDDRRFFQKYSLDARWYPLWRMIIDLGGYYKDNRYDYNFPTDGSPNNAGQGSFLYPGFLTIEQFRTWDGNFRWTLRPLPNVSLVSRYEYQLSTIDTAPDPASGLSEAQSSRMTSHIIAQDISWIPWSRLSLQAGFNYVLSETATPAFTPSAGAVLDAENNYWTVNFSSTFVVDDKSDLNVDYFYYQADDYQNNAPAGLPLGSGAREHGVTATLTRHINPRTSASLKYGYYHYTDALTGGAADFTAQLILATLQVRF